MDAERRAEITGWDAREFSDGFAELGRLVDRGFSGAVTNGTGWLFVFEGRVVGTADADLDAFADASGTIYTAPAEVLPVLFAMQEQGGEPRAQYYTNDTPLSEADRKLTQGGFTGYVELSENVLSGDYYVTYTAGEPMAAAYVGNSRRLETGEEAFELADDEVGIYTVYEVDLDVREIPEPESPEPEASDGAAAGAAATSDADPIAIDSEEGEAGEDETVETETAEDEPTRDAAPDDAAPNGVTPGDGTETSGEATARESPDEEPVDREAQSRPGARDDGQRDGETPRAGRERPVEPNGSEAETDAAESADIGDADAQGAGSDAAHGASEAPNAPGAPDAPDSEGDRPDDDVFSEEEQWREQKSIPALDPSEASDPPGDRSGGEAEPDATDRPSNQATERRRSGSGDRGRDVGSAAGNGDDRSPEPRSTQRDRSKRSAVSQRGSRSSTGERAGDPVGERVEQLRAELEAAEEKRASLEAERDDLAADRDEIAAERDELATEVDRLESELSTLREERDRLETRREELQSDLVECRTRLDRTAAEAVATFNDHADALVDALDYGNVTRVRLTRTTGTDRSGADVGTFDIRVVREGDEGVFEDSPSNLSESEREVVGLVLALAGYLVHDVSERCPFLLLDSLEAIDAERIAELVEYFADHATYLVVALLEADASAVETAHDRITEI